eukprot:m.184651 g.184651  ORF g.184651 m.184651 type:complete len:870 (+) comp16673_c1_seq1:139-2748(+)
MLRHLALLTLAVAAASADILNCGKYASTCSAQLGAYVDSSMTIHGSYSGDFSLSFDVYTDTQCAKGSYSVRGAGTWMDLNIVGQDNDQDRYWQVTYESVAVTTLNDDMTNRMNNGCPCGGTWVAGQERVLTSCPPGTCHYTGWLGGWTDPGTAGVEIGNAAFGFAEADGGKIALSFLDASYPTGMGFSSENIWLTINRVENCGPIRPSHDVCGAWEQRCNPAFVDGAKSMSAELVYEGNTGDPYESGIYKEKVIYYAEQSCGGALFSTETESTLQFDAASKRISGGLRSVRRVPYISVRPLVPTAVTMLSQRCPCGDASLWVLDKARRLTSCKLEQCKVDFFNNMQLTGFAFADNWLTSTQNHSTPEMRRTPLTTQFQSTTQTEADLGHGYVFVNNSCEYPYDARLDICGTWNLKCSTGDLGDEEISYVITGSAGDNSQGSGTGSISRERLVYSKGSGCNKEPFLLVNDKGFWTDMGNVTTSFAPGGRKILINFLITTVEAYSNVSVALLNASCPCGGEWKLGEPRIIAKCPPNTCDVEAITFGYGSVGTPGYGIIRDQEGLIRISDLRKDPGDGYTEFLGLDDFPLRQTEKCQPPNYESTYAGEWARPCDNGTSGVDFEGSLSIDGSQYSMVHYYFPTGDGCRNAPILIIEQAGKVSFGGNAQNVPSGKQLTFSPSQFNVTPLNDFSVQLLNQECPCSTTGSIWEKNVTTNVVNGCPAGTCDKLGLIRQPFGARAYGVVLRHDEFMRMTQLYADRTTGFAATFNVHDYYWVLEQAYPSSGGRKSGIDAGGVLLLVVFFAALIYLVGGMALNYRSSGTPRIPHAEFWTELPGLISAGFAFTLSGCGLFGRKKYAAMTNPENDTSSYGAL